MASHGQTPARQRLRYWFSVGLLCVCLPGLAGEEISLEQLKAAYVYNFLKFTTWPEENGQETPLQLCLGNADTTLQHAFASLNGQQVNGRTIVVRDSPIKADAKGCHVYYLRQGGAPVALRPLVALHPELLTIGDDEAFVEQGGIIGLREVDGRLQFDINLALIRRGRYQISAALLLKSGNYPAVWRSDLLGSPPGVPDGQVQAQDQQLETVQPSLGATWFVDRLDG